MLVDPDIYTATTSITYDASVSRTELDQVRLAVQG